MKQNTDTTEGAVRVARGTDRMKSGQSLKACLPEEIYEKYFPAHKRRREEFRELEKMYKR